MNKGFWVAITLLMICNPLFARTHTKTHMPTMQYFSQPSGAISFPAAFGISNLAPVPQNICSPTITAGSQSATCSGLPVCKGAAAQTAAFSCAVTTTCNSTVSAKGSCTLSLNVTKPSSLPASTPFNLIISYGSYNAMLVSNAFTMNTIPIANSYRTITFKNSCAATIWFGSITGAAPTKNILTSGAIDCSGGNPGKQACVAAGGACYSQIGAPDACLSQSCASDSDCVTGASCYTPKSKCFWNNPTPDNGSFQLTSGNTNTIKIPEYDSNNIGVVWSGAFGGRTGCTSGGCTSGLCTTGSANAQGVCTLGAGFQQPATQSEPTFITYPTGTTPTTATDAYDVTLINGANVPISMYPTNEPLPTSGNPYTCGAAGYNQAVPAAGPAANTIGASSWQLATNQANLAYRYIVPTSATPARCAADTDCVSSEYCGLTYSSQSIGSTTSPGSGFLVCGTFAGWFTADQICGTNNTFSNAIDKNGASVENFQCGSPVALGTMANLYQCNANYAVSCYSSASPNCCGCVNWSSQGTVVQVPSNPAYVAACTGSNSTWTGSFTPINQPQVYDTILFLKQSCPSCYTYPFDDKSSSFTCTNGTNTSHNTESYTVEFCPGGNGTTGFEPPAH
jgi:hypothetical protein